MSAAVIDEATGVIYTKSALASPPEAPQVLPSMGQVNMLWQHYKTARSTLERLVEGGGAKAPVDVHSPYAERAVRLLEVLILRKEKGKAHFMNMTLGAPVIPNNPEFDPDGEGKRRAELPPTEDVRELVARMLAELEHAMRPTVRPGGRALHVSNAGKALQEALEKARATTPKPTGAAILATEGGCCSSSSSSAAAACSGKDKAAAAPTAAGLRHRHHHQHSHKKGHSHSHSHAGGGGGCCSSDKQEAGPRSLAATVAALVAWAKAALSGPEQVKEHLHMPGGGCCGGGAVGPSRMGEKQDGHAFMVGVLALVLLLPFVLWWMS